jgi:hypothetical protein
VCTLGDHSRHVEGDVILRHRSGPDTDRIGADRKHSFALVFASQIKMAGIRRVKGVKKLGMGLGNGLMAEQGHALWQAPHHPRLKENAVPRLAGVDTRVGIREARRRGIEIGSSSGALADC